MIGIECPGFKQKGICMGKDNGYSRWRFKDSKDFKRKQSSMSTAELIPLFPSATHPALPIASRILSTLRQLTGPGKGNDLRPEERAALVGVSALFGCERLAFLGL